MGEAFYLPVTQHCFPPGLQPLGALGAPLLCFLWQRMAHSCSRVRAWSRESNAPWEDGVAKDEGLSPPRQSLNLHPLSAGLSASLQSLPAPLPPAPFSFHYSMSSFQLITFLTRAGIWFFPPSESLKRHSKVCPLKSVWAGISHPTSPSSFAPTCPVGPSAQLQGPSALW